MKDTVTYYELLERKAKELQTKHRFAHELLVDITRKMNEGEELWLTVSHFRSRKKSLNRLIELGFLILDASKNRFSFRHQTMFEFWRARIFVDSPSVFANFVLNHQDGLTVRPVVWDVLSFLRDTNRIGFWNQIQALLESQPRFHIKALIVDFLTASADSEKDSSFLSELLDHESELRNRILNRATYNRFLTKQLLHSKQFRLFMSDAKLIPTIVRMLQVSSEEVSYVASLLAHEWLPKPNLDWHTATVLESLDDSKIIVDLLLPIVERTKLHRIQLISLMKKLRERKSSDMIPPLVIAELSRELKEAQLIPEVLPENESSEIWEFMAQRFRNPRLKALRQILDASDWYELSVVIDECSRAYFEVMWKFLEDFLPLIQDRDHEFLQSYIHDSSWATNLRDFYEQRIRQHTVIASLGVAIETFARSQPMEFIEFEKNNSSNFMVLNRLLAIGYIQIAHLYPHEAAQFLTTDARRMRLGDSFNEHKESINLLRRLGKFCTDEDLGTLEQSILEWNGYYTRPQNETKEDRIKRDGWNRGHRYQLLRNIPLARLSSVGKETLESLQREFGTKPQEDNDGPKVEWIGSPISIEQMLDSTPEELLNAFEDLDDSTDDEHPLDWSKGGTIQASAELARMARTDPEKAKALALMFDPSTHSTPVGNVLAGLAESKAPTEVEEFLFELNDHGFNNDSYVGSAITAVEELVKKGRFDERILSLLLDWLSTTTHNQNQARASEIRDNQSAIWDSFGDAISSTVHFRIYQTLSIGCLRSKPPLVDLWLDILYRAARANKGAEFWQGMFWYFRYLGWANQIRAEKLLRSVFAKYTELIETESTWRMLARIQSWLSGKTMKDLFFLLRRGTSNSSLQAYGELLMLHHLWFPSRKWAHEDVEKYLGRNEEHEKLILVGFAYTLGRACLQSTYRHHALELGAKVLSLNKPELTQAFSTMAYLDFELEPDEFSRKLISLVLQNPPAMEQGMYKLTNKIEPLFEWDPDLCLSYCELAINRLSELRTTWEFRDVLGSIASMSITAQRFGLEIRRRGMDLFETLMRLDLPEAESALKSMDLRALPLKGSRSA